MIKLFLALVFLSAILVGVESLRCYACSSGNCPVLPATYPPVDPVRATECSSETACFTQISTLRGVYLGCRANCTDFFNEEAATRGDLVNATCCTTDFCNGDPRMPPSSSLQPMPSLTLLPLVFLALGLTLKDLFLNIVKDVIRG